MKRLTKRSNKTSHENGVCCTHFMSKECIQLQGECAWGCKWEEAVWSKLADHEDAEEKGLLFKMPCKPGDTVWILFSDTKEIKSFKVSKITIGKNHDNVTMTDKSIFTIWGKNWDEYFNRHIYPTKEEAEQALARMEKDNG